MFYAALGVIVLAALIGYAVVSGRSLTGRDLFSAGPTVGPYGPAGVGGSGLPAPDVAELDMLFRQVMTLIDEAEARALSGCHIGRGTVRENACKRHWVNRFNRQRKRVTADFRRALRRYTGGGLAKLLSAGAELAASIGQAQTMGAAGAVGQDPP